MKRVLILLAGVLTMASAQAWDHHCKFNATSEDTIKADGVRLLEIDARAGLLRVEGQSGSKTISVEAEACATRKNLLEEVEWRMERSGDRIRLAVDLPDPRNNNYAVLNLVVEIPRGLDLDVRDSSGSIVIADAGAVRVRDSSGSLEIDGADGSVIVDDSSGSLSVEDVSGHVEIRDGSGSIKVENVRGSVRVAEDGSGSIDIDEVEGDVEIGNDGSGSISVADVGGNFTVRRDGSGSISHRRVAGRVSLPND